MREPTQSRFDEKLVRFATGEITPEEARELAQASLGSPAWFDELTATALAKTAVSSVPIPAVSARRAWWRSSLLLAAAAAVIIGIIFVPYAMRTSQNRNEPIRIATPQSTVTPAPIPTLAFIPVSTQPILLAQNLQSASRMAEVPVFRGENERIRSPRQTGVIISVEDGQATINLGSTDGLVKGSEVEVFRDRALRDRLGTLHVTTVFRQQARGDVSGIDLNLKQAIRVADRDHVHALLQQVTNLQTRGHLNDARRAAGSALEWTDNARVTPSQKASATELVAQLDFQAKDLVASETHYRAALDLLNADPHASPDDLAQIQNDLAVVLMLRGDYASADELLRRTPPIATKANIRAERLNNLGVLAETHGDHQQAESFYTQTLAILPQNLPNERRIAEANLTRLKGLH